MGLRDHANEIHGLSDASIADASDEPFCHLVTAGNQQHSVGGANVLREDHSHLDIDEANFPHSGALSSLPFEPCNGFECSWIVSVMTPNILPQISPEIPQAAA